MKAKIRDIGHPSHHFTSIQRVPQGAVSIYGVLFRSVNPIKFVIGHIYDDVDRYRLRFIQSVTAKKVIREGKEKLSQILESKGI